MSLFTWYNQNDHSVWVKDLHYIDDDCVTEVPINDATVTAQVVSPSGADVGAPLNLAYVSGSDGVYRGNTADFLDVGGYRVKYTVASAAGNAEKWDDLVVKERT